jgi:hypothetical protein
MKGKKKKPKVVFNLPVALHAYFLDGTLMWVAARGNAEKRPATFGKFNWKQIRASKAAAPSSPKCSQLGTNRTSSLVLDSVASVWVHLFLLYKIWTWVQNGDIILACRYVLCPNYWTELHKIWYWRFYTKRCWQIYVRSITNPTIQNTLKSVSFKKNTIQTRYIIRKPIQRFGTRR